MFTEKKNRVNFLTTNDTNSISNKTTETTRLPPSVPPKQIVETNNDDVSPTWRKPYTRQTKSDLSSPIKSTGSFSK